ncbi:MAG: type II toxin-antitoxin system Phd/YefM family antitoxin [Candidatus Woesebacteria bacterium]
MTIHLVTTLKRKATQILHEVNKTKTPILITEYGKPSAYIIDAQSFQETQQKIAILEGLARGEQAIKGGRVTSHTDAMKMFKRWLD